jgi:ACS family hexuronate transporter-like MFS transporter
MGNSILQSGAAFGAVLTPAIIQMLVPESEPESWPRPFFVIGALGVCWVGLWFLTVKASALGSAEPTAAARDALGLAQRTVRAPLPRGLLLWRFAALVVLVITVNACWHFYRAWLPLFLQQEQGYTQSESNGFFTLYYVAAGIGSWGAGLATLWIVRLGMSVHRGRLLVFFGFALLAALGIAAALVPSGPWLPALLLLVAVGALGVFPNYYSFSQELTTVHQGKLTGVLGCLCWLAMAALHEMVGRFMESSPSYRPAIAMVALLPLVGGAVFMLLWGNNPVVHSAEDEESAYPLPSPAESDVDSRFGPAAVVTIRKGD